MVKSVPDRILKGMILQTILTGENEGNELTSKEIHEFISTNEFYFESPETDRSGNPMFAGNYRYNNLPGLRRTLTYLRNAGYVTKKGSKPFTFHLTAEGRLHAQDPFYKYNLKMQYTRNLANEIVTRTLANDEKVEELAEKKRIEKCKVCKFNRPPEVKRRPATKNTVRPIKNIIKVEVGDDIKEIEITPDGKVKELEELKASLVMNGNSPDTASTILTLQNKVEYLASALRKAGGQIVAKERQLDKEINRKARTDRKTQARRDSRLEIAQMYWGYSLDAEFFKAWGGSLRVVEYRRTVGREILERYFDIQSANSEIMTRTGYAKGIVHPDAIIDLGIYIAEIVEGSIIVDSEYFRSPKRLKF